MAASGNAMRRSHHGICADDWRDVSAYSSRPAMACVVVDSLSQRTHALAELSVAAGVGFFCDQHVPAFQSSVSGAAVDTGLRADPRQNEGMAELALRKAEHGLAGHTETVAQTRI